MADSRKFDPEPRVSAEQMVTQWSADMQWWWDGQKWIAAAQLRRPGAVVPDAPVSPSLLTFGAFACLGLALLSYVILLTPMIFLTPVASLISIGVGRGTLQSLPKSAMRNRWIAGIGMVIAALPLAVVILGIVALQLLIVFVMVTGNHSAG